MTTSRAANLLAQLDHLNEQQLRCLLVEMPFTAISSPA
jgi:hypothetical protein